MYMCARHSHHRRTHRVGPPYPFTPCPSRRKVVREMARPCDTQGAFTHFAAVRCFGPSVRNPLWNTPCFFCILPTASPHPLYARPLPPPTYHYSESPEDMEHLQYLNNADEHFCSTERKDLPQNPMVRCRRIPVGFSP